MLPLVLSLFLAAPSPAASSRVEIRSVGTYPEFRIDGKPFFIHAAAFFYFRHPRDLWESSLATYKEMGINTIDLYIPWNWHEASPGELDFDGRTNPRKDLLGLLEIISRLGLRAMVRPGPYICNEWRNGGYPDWLLSDPSYRMPRRSILEGRYPPLSSLQYSNLEAAAQGWLENPRHLRETRRWYHEVASRVINPHSIEKGGPVMMVQLDDDHGAGNRYDGPNFWKYMKWLRDAMLQEGVSLPMFLNPEETTIPSLGDEALGPPHLWIMTQWSQRFLGADLSTASILNIEASVQPLKSSAEFPPSVVEFNSGFFALENSPYGTPTHPMNTLTASRILFQNGLKSLVYFPLQDSLYPAGWEIPSANPHYTWECPLDVSGAKKPKAWSVERNGGLVTAAGELLASSHEWADAGVINPLQSMELAGLGAAELKAVEKDFAELSQWLVDRRIAVDWVDPQAQPLEALLSYPVILELAADKLHGAKHTPKSRRALRDYQAGGGKLATWDPSSPWAVPARVSTDRRLYASELVSNEGSRPLGLRDPGRENFGFVFLTNVEDREVRTGLSAADPYNGEKRIALERVAVPARDSLALPLRVRFGRLLPRRPEFIEETDEIAYATGELSSVSASSGTLRLGFYAPGGAEVALRLARAPRLFLVDGKPVEAPRNLVSLPPGRVRTLELVYGSRAADAPAKTEKPVRVLFPSQVDYRLRPDIALPSVPALLSIVPGKTLPLILENPSTAGRSVTLRWSSARVKFKPNELMVRLKPGQSRRLSFRLSAPAGLHPATLLLETKSSREELETRLIRVPSGRAIGYPFDFDRDGNQEWVLENERMRIALSPASGGRIFQLVDKRTGINHASTAGLLRDQFSLMEPLDVEWNGKKLPSWTRSRSPGLNTRPYSIMKVFQDGERSGVTLKGSAPDVRELGAEIEKTISLGAPDRALDVYYRVHLSSAPEGQAFRVRDVFLLEKDATFEKRLETDSFELGEGPSRPRLSWSPAASVLVSAKGRYTVVEAELRPGKPSNQDYRYHWVSYSFSGPERRSPK